MMLHILRKSVPYVVAFAGALFLTLFLTPIVREFNRRLGMVDKPGARRINKVPIPRGGGLALMLGVLVSYSIFALVTKRPAMMADGLSSMTYWKLAALSAAIAAVGYVDDKAGMKPVVKLFAQIAVAALAWWWVGLGFARLFTWIPWWLDLPVTVFWIVGAINAFNLIDGLDGLASGLALIATFGMAGSLFLIETPQVTLFHFAFAGGLIGFLRYNFNPASVFLGDCGSMFIGFTMAVLPLVHQATDSLVVSIAVPLLAMGVPVFDTFLAIVRRVVRHLLARRDSTEKGNGQVMTADADHIHHRILRAVGLNQRKAAIMLYAVAVAAVVVGLAATALKSRAAGLWLAAFSLALVVAFKDMSQIELFDAGRLLNSIARDRSNAIRRRWARLTVPVEIAFDFVALVCVFFLCAWAQGVPVNRIVFRVSLPLRIVPMFAALVFFRAYSTIWARAMVSNYVRLALACIVGTLVGSVAVYYSPAHVGVLKEMALCYAPISFVVLAAFRALRNILRDFFYALDCSRLNRSEGVSRILVYGTGLRYRAFRRELVRSAAANTRMIVGLIDDDILLRGGYIGGLKVLGTLSQAPAIIRELNIDAVVVAFEVDDAWMNVVRKTLEPTGVKISRFGLVEELISDKKEKAR